MGASCDNPTERLVWELSQLALDLPKTHSQARRLRIAVTPAEMEAIEVYMLKEVGVSYRRIRGCTLVAEESPLNQMIAPIFAPASIEDAAEGNS